MAVCPLQQPHRDRVLEIFFDCTESDIADDVILTPIPAFYRTLLDGGDRVAEHAGWWRLANITKGSQNYCVVLHFEGSRVVDPVRALVNDCRRLAFLGLVGGVTPETEIGGLVRITSAGRATGAIASGCGPELLDAEIPSVRALTGNGLLDDPVGVCAAARRMSASVVDLETFFFFEALRVAGPVEGIALGLITDRPGVVPFWDVRLDDGDLAMAGIRMASVILGHWLSAQ